MDRPILKYFILSSNLQQLYIYIYIYTPLHMQGWAL